VGAAEASDVARRTSDADGDVGRVVLGLDGCPSGWVAVTLTGGRVSEVAVVEAAVDAIGRSGAHLVGVDMPVGLVDGARDTDAAARRLLPGRASSVFSTAPLAVVRGHRDGSITDHATASEVTRRVSGMGLSQQAWRLVPKMAEVDDLARSSRRDGGLDLREVHPELAFATVAGAPLPRKRSWAGVEARRSLLARLGLMLPERFPGDAAAAPDDVLDAAICAWVVDGIALGGDVGTVPPTTRQRAHGRPIVIHVRRS